MTEWVIHSVIFRIKTAPKLPHFQTYKKSPAGHCPTREWNFIDKLFSLLRQRYGKNVVNLH